MKAIIYPRPGCFTVRVSGVPSITKTFTHRIDAEKYCRRFERLIAPIIGLRLTNDDVRNAPIIHKTRIPANDEESPDESYVQIGLDLAERDTRRRQTRTI